jgi:glycosyltransferase involved in cell wall biosynthesis
MKVVGLRVCYVSPEMFHWGVHGGFGYITWTLSRKLVERGHEACVVTPRRKGQGCVEDVDGVKVYGFDTFEDSIYPVSAIQSRRDSLKYYRMADADIYHSQALSYNTYAAHLAMPGRKHVLTFQDPYDQHEWRRIARVVPRYGRISHILRVEAEIRFLARTCRLLDTMYSQAHFLVQKSRKLYGLDSAPEFLPNPVPIPEELGMKSEKPTVCFLARWDPQKRVELFLRMAKEHPDIEFIAMGKSHDQAFDSELRARYGGLPNLRLTGFVSEEEKSRILASSWALMNTSVREALPVSFLEALAHKTPIISGENPDDLTSSYGFHVQGEDYEEGLRWLLESDDWRQRGEDGRCHVGKVFEMEHVIDLHLEKYKEIAGEN